MMKKSQHSTTGTLQTFIDLFAGVGGFHMALRKLGMKCVFASEKDTQCRATYLLNHGMLPAGDIYRVPVEKIPFHDVACFGLPCQAWSRSGSQGGKSDPRGLLHLEAIRILEHHRPNVALVENVPQFKSLDGGPAYEELTGALRRWGYAVQDEVLNASGFGVPQNRERLYIVAIRKDVMVQPFRFPEPGQKRVELTSVLEPPELTVRAATAIKKYRRIDPEKIRWERTGKGIIKLGDVRDDTQGDRIYSPKGHSATLTSTSGGWGAGMGLYEVDGIIRRLTAREAARCQGYPESFRFLCAPRRTCSQLGNSVAVPVVMAVMNEVFRAVGQSTTESNHYPGGI